LSFVQLLADPENIAQKNLIDASIDAGVKRFAPSEWGRLVATFLFQEIVSDKMKCFGDRYALVGRKRRDQRVPEES